MTQGREIDRLTRFHLFDEAKDFLTAAARPDLFSQAG
jgi:hypothetical protein